MLSIDYPARKRVPQENPNEVILGGESHVEKVLGTVWLPEKDTFTFKMKIELAK